MKLFILILIILLALLQYKLWFENGGVAKVWHLQQSITQQTQENNHLQERNTALSAEVKDLKQGRAAIEEHARTEFGMVKKGETYYQVVDK